MRHRKSLRLPGYDYASPGAYFVTTVTWRREHLFGEVAAGEMRLNAFGEIVLDCWRDLPNHYPHVALDAFVVMPNHIHGIIFLKEDDAVVGEGLRPSPTTAAAKRHALPEIVRALKSFSARRINELRGTPGVRVWERSFYEHIIRTERALRAIRRYILNNPLKWELDRENR